jgi:hypothetical protein
MKTLGYCPKSLNKLAFSAMVSHQLIDVDEQVAAVLSLYS